MNHPFRLRGDEIAIDLSARERAVLRQVPAALETLGRPDSDPAAARLNPSAYPEDREADTQFRELTADDLAKARVEDRRRFLDTLDARSMGLGDAAAWMRIVGDTRLLLAARMGIESEEWEMDGTLAESAEGAMLHYLGFIQDALVEVLSSTLDG